jgi:hypothetical protein
MAVGNFLFLRLFCPALVDSFEYGLTDAPPDSGSLRLLVLISKVLQGIVTGSSFRYSSCPSPLYRSSSSSSVVRIWLLTCCVSSGVLREDYMQNMNAFTSQNLQSLLQYLDDIAVSHHHHPSAPPPTAHSLSLSLVAD